MADGSNSPHPNSGPTLDVSALWAAIRALEEKFEARNATIATNVRLILTQLEHLTMAAAPPPTPPYFRGGDAAIPPLLVLPHTHFISKLVTLPAHPRSLQPTTIVFGCLF
ncbi:hypothetical protein TIFTF001_050146 [Ficus carica]|uniref:Uncharacterized protein n=1 Tax=Ficus carica TaxID=3494 RepID=A0AA87YRG9_FICCA|nr:hypothetical protein TIFTF001_050146 [Ficus carica]